MIDETIINRIFERVEKRISDTRRYPVSTYRFQFNRNFTFRDAAALVPYLHALGITDVYASPCFKARTGSMHGYDATDYNALNPEIGSEADYRKFVNELHNNGMGLIMDFVPNHMSTIDNPWWTDVLENGMSSPYAPFFDIDWYPAKVELHGKVLVPILEGLYGKVLKAGKLQLSFDRDSFLIRYYERLLPVSIKSAVLPLETCLKQFQNNHGSNHTDIQDLQSIVTACRSLPADSGVKPELIDKIAQEKRVIKKRLGELYKRSENIQGTLSLTLDIFNGKAGENKVFNQLHELLEQQSYRLGCWRTAFDEINYRRFFDINELAALHMENRQVFDLCHRLLFKLIHNGDISGVRLDHVDGLFNPLEYFWRLQQARFLQLCRDEINQYGNISKTDLAFIEEKLLERFEEKRKTSPDSSTLHPLFIVVEKILGWNETLRDDWPVDGTTGYDSSAILNGIFVNTKNERRLRNIYRQFTGAGEDFDDLAYTCKSLIIDSSMYADIYALAGKLDKISEKSRLYRDFTLHSLAQVIKEVIACFPVYRTYIDVFQDSVTGRDKIVIDTAIDTARKRNPALSSWLFDFLRDTLLLKYPPDIDEEARREFQHFVMRFQQLTGTVMAKGVEDTAFYRYNPLVSLNEVGGSPGRFGNTVDEFYRYNTMLQRKWPHSLIGTSTHDSKRSEDVRARIDVLSEIPIDWKAALFKWGRINKHKKRIINEMSAPDNNEECMIYQALLGTYPFGKVGAAEHEEYIRRIQDYMLKAIREAKVHSSWISPDTAYEEAVKDFVSVILDTSSSNGFRADFLEFSRQVTQGGMYNSLSQVVLKAFSPGVPDFYQGNELWNFSLVDPDNRRPVDFPRHIGLLDSIEERSSGKKTLTELAKELTDKMESGEIKLYTIHVALEYRRNHTSLFEKGTYIPLKADGSRKTNICAFAWQEKLQQCIIAAPRMIAGLTQNGKIQPTGPQAWEDTVLLLPGRLRSGKYRNIFTGELPEGDAGESGLVLPLAKVMAVFPVAVLENIVTNGKHR